VKTVEPLYCGVVIPLCRYCAHLDRSFPLRCRAYPQEIPLEIRWQNVDHREEYLADQGVRFALAEDLDEWHYEWFLKEQTRSEEEKGRYQLQIDRILQRRNSGA
jgi:hypothetical protein